MPTGEYVLRASVDLSPALDRLVITKKVRIEQPPADVLDQTLTRLRSEDVAVRRAAVNELFWFPEDGEEIVPVLLVAVKDEDAKVRQLALGCLARYPKEAGPHYATFLTIARGGEKITPWERMQAAWLLARTAPENAEVEKVLLSLAVTKDEFLKERCGFAIQVYKGRFLPQSPAEDPR